MNLKTRLWELSGAAITAVLFGCSLTLTLLDAMSVPFRLEQVVLWSLLTAFCCAMFLLGRIPALLSTVVLSGGIAALAVRNVHIISEIKQTAVSLLGAITGAEGSLSEHALVILISLAVVLTLISFLMCRLNGGVYPALLMFMLVLMGGWFIEKRMIVVYTVPGLIALAVLYARAHREGAGYLKTIPTALIAALLAVWLLPAGEVTWTPLRSAAEKVQELFNDYFMFTDPRTVYSVSSDGYQPQGETLGGPASPRDAEIMTVKTDRLLFLRGSIRRTYTGYSWVDNSLNSRYLYIDPTRQALRDGVFDLDLNQALTPVLKEVSASVSILNEGTSTVFVPHRLKSLSLPLDLVAYHNDSGEVFITRGVEYGDHYDLTAYVVDGEEEEIIAALSSVVPGSDPDYYGIMENYMNIPSGMEDDVYWLTRSLTEDAKTPYEKAKAIQNHLLYGGYTYRMDVELPPSDRDFVSYFLLDSKEGYCTYFASAMAVMARLAGLPSRYVEGYLVPSEPDGETLVTGENAHAWVEIYFEGAGWIPFDPTPGDEQGEGDAGSIPPELNETPEPTPTPIPTPNPDAGDDHSGEHQPDQHETATPEPTVTPEVGEESGEDVMATPTPNPGEAPPDSPENDPNEQGKDDSSDSWARILMWVCIILAIVLLVILLILRRWRRTDPAVLAGKQGDDSTRMMLWYRTILSLLMRGGFVPEGGETPESFARRLVHAGAAPEQMIALAMVIQRQQYAHRPPDRNELELARNVYQRLLIQMSPKKRMAWHVYRMMHGTGDFRQIP